MIVFSKLTAHSDFDIGSEIVTAAGVHDGDADLEDQEPYDDYEDDDADDIRTEDKLEDEHNKEREK